MVDFNNKRVPWVVNGFLQLKSLRVWRNLLSIVEWLGSNFGKDISLQISGCPKDSYVLIILFSWVLKQAFPLWCVFSLNSDLLSDRERVGFAGVFSFGNLEEDLRHECIILVCLKKTIWYTVDWCNVFCSFVCQIWKWLDWIVFWMYFDFWRKVDFCCLVVFS